MTRLKKVISGMVILVSIFAVSGTANAQEKIDINTASLEELQELEGVKAPLAQKIIDNRLYGSVDDLSRIQGIGANKLENIKKQGLAYVGELEKVELNTASFEELLTLSSVEKVLAQRIIDNRPYDSLDDLKKIQGIGSVKFANITTQGLAYVMDKNYQVDLTTIFKDPYLILMVSNALGIQFWDRVSLNELSLITSLETPNLRYMLTGSYIGNLDLFQEYIKNPSETSVEVSSIDLTNISLLTNLKEFHLPPNFLQNTYISNEISSYLIFKTHHNLTKVNINPNTFNKLKQLEVLELPNGTWYF